MYMIGEMVSGNLKGFEGAWLRSQKNNPLCGLKECTI